MVALHGAVQGCVANSVFVVVVVFSFKFKNTAFWWHQFSLLWDFCMTVDQVLQGCVIYCFLLLFFIQKRSYLVAAVLCEY